MAKRNIIQTAEKLVQCGKHDYLTAYSLSVEEIEEFLEMYTKNKIDTIVKIFQYGFVLGVRARSRNRCPDL